MDSIRNLHIDIETYSSINLAKSGVYRYAEASDFEILLFCYSIDEEEPIVVDLALGEKIPKEIIEALTDVSLKNYIFISEYFDIFILQFTLVFIQGVQTSLKLSIALFIVH